MNEIHLKKNGLLVHDEKQVTADGLIFLSYKLHLENDCTLRSFFQMLDAYPVLSNLNPFLPVFVEQYRACPEKNCTADDIDYLELTKTIEMIGFPGDPRIEIYMSLVGVKGSDSRAIKSLWLENLLDFHIKLGRLKHVVFGDKVDTMSFETIFNLFEFIDGISWQLSFHNMPVECRINL